MTRKAATPRVRAVGARKPADGLRMPERTLQELVRRTALVFGWLHYHTHDSRRSAPGFPDSVLVRDSRRVGQLPRLLVAELKTERGKVTADQARWLEALTLAGVECHVWRPSNWVNGDIERILRGENSEQ